MFGVPEKRSAYRRHLHSDLMASACFELDIDKTHFIVDGQRLILQNGFLPLLLPGYGIHHILEGFLIR